MSVLIGCTVSCSTLQWEKRHSDLTSEYNLFNTSSTAGTGLKLERHAYQPRRCIKSADSSTTGGILSVEFIDPASVSSGEGGAYKEFFQSSIRRSSEYNITGLNPFSVACVITVSDRINYLIDNSIELGDAAKELLGKKEFSNFYSLCGTQFVSSTTFESSIAFVVTYYMPSGEVDSFRNKIRYGKNFTGNDVGNFSVFNEAGRRYPVFFSLKSSGDSLYIPSEFPLASNYGNGIEDFLKTAINACLSSSGGKVSSVQVKKWTDLPEINKYNPEITNEKFPEETHDIIEAMSQDMFDFSIFRMSISRHRTEKTDEKINSLIRNINWGNFYKCRWGLVSDGYVNPDLEKDCSTLLQGFNDFRKVENYNPLVSGLDKKNRLSIDSFRDLRLVDKTTILSAQNYNESEYRFNDKTLYIKIPEKVKPGQTIDSSGKLFSTDCIRSDSVKLIKKEKGDIATVNDDCYPVDFREWGLLKKIFFFWEKPPPRRPLYRGNMEVTGFSDELCDDFKLTDEAVELARKDLLKFYEKYGTHYVSQVKVRRGIVYYFSIDSEKDSDITVEPYGISVTPFKIGDITPPTDSCCIGGGCMSSILGQFLNQKQMEPLLNPETVRGFFNTKKDFARILTDGSESVPVELYLKPWSQYLIGKGILRVDQTVPVTLFEDERKRPTEGNVSITDSEGNLYVGEMSNGLKNGYGVLRTPGGSEYKGNWMGDLMHGQGVYRHKDGNIYTGDFMYGYPHGTGEHQRVSGNVYRGSVRRGKITGNGEMLYNDGRRYRGDFIDGKPDGYGIMDFPDGKRVEGLFRNGVYTGE